jgi:predicted  nucleic acid-binding Zn-ribbon protein
MSEDLTKELPETDSEKLTLILTSVQALTGRVESVESLRPFLHKVVDDISQIRTDISEIRTDMSEIRTDMSEIRTDVSQLQEGQIELRSDVLQLHEGQRAVTTEVRALRRDMDHRFSNVYTKLLEIETDHCDIHDRVTRLELNSSPPNTQT